MEKRFLKIKKIIEDKFLRESDFKIKTYEKCWMVFCASVISFQITVGKESFLNIKGVEMVFDLILNKEV